MIHKLYNNNSLGKQITWELRTMNVVPFNKMSLEMLFTNGAVIAMKAREGWCNLTFPLQVFGQKSFVWESAEALTTFDPRSQ